MTGSEALLWTKPSWRQREFVLTREGEELARLTFEGWATSAARIRTAKGEWSVRRDGFWRSRVIMQGGGTLLTARGGWSGNYDLESAFEDAVRWGSFSVWRQQYGWRRADGTALVIYRPVTAFSQRVQAVDVLMPGDLTSSRVLLIALGGYFLQRIHEDMAASAAAVSA
jgi:hypothetical protein